MHDSSGRHQTPAVRRAERADHRIIGPALLLSALAHALLLFGLSFQIVLEPRQRPAPASRVVHVAPAMQAFDIIEVPGEVATIDVQVLERAPLQPRPVRPVAPDAGREAARPVERAGEPIDRTPVRDRLRYRLNAPEVWRPPSEEVVVEPSPQDIVQQRIAAQLGEFNDSVAAEAAAAERALDWTTTDADGNRWGVSPGAIHLGSLTIPIGDTRFAVAPGRREEFEGRVRTWGELRDQAVREEARSTFKDRVKAIEDRMDRERAARAATGSASTPPPEPAQPTPPGGAGTSGSEGAGSTGSPPRRQ